MSMHRQHGFRTPGGGRRRPAGERGQRARWLAMLLPALMITVLIAPSGLHAQEVHGFVEALNGVRTTLGDGFIDGSYTARESRLQLRVSDYSDEGEYFVRVDFPFDQVADDREVELREAFLTYTGFGSVDFKIGRQIMTWGTGDLLFVNDRFPKDWQSFFIGREDQYLKAPMDAVRIGIYSGVMNLNVALMPQFEPDRLPSPDRLAFYNPLGMPVMPLEPAGEIGKGEVALRAYRNIGGTEVAFYGYFGQFRQPLGYDAGAMRPFYPRLNVYGASLRRGLLGGVANLEVGFYDSLDDGDGTDPLVENSSLRGLIGLDRQLWTDFQLGLQGYYEQRQDHDGYVAGLAPGAHVADELRQVYTARLTQWLKYQTVTLSLFTFVSPTDEDLYIRAAAGYKLSDPIEVTLGANVFGGAHRETLFGQLDRNDNVYLRARYSF